MSMEKPWDWRKASGGWTLPTDHPNRLFHAYDINNHAACAPSLGLAASCEDPTEGSTYCAECIAIVQATPGGRERIEYAR